MLWKPVGLGVVVLLLPVAALGQGETEVQSPETQPSAAAPAAPRTPKEALDLIEQLLDSARAARDDDRPEESRAQLAEAQRGLRTLLEAGLHSPRAKVLEGDLLTEAGEHSEARKRYKEVLEVDKFNFRANLGLGRFYVLSRLWRQAALYLREAQRVAPRGRQAEVLRLLAVCLSGQGKPADAVSYAEQAVAADPEGFKSLQLLVQVCIDARQHESAVEAAQSLLATVRRYYQAQPAERSRVQRLLVAHETLLAALREYHNTLYRRDARGAFTDQVLPGQEAEAARVLSQMARVGEEQAELRRLLASYDVLVVMERAVEYQPDNTSYLLDLAGLLLATNQTERAIETYQRILQVSDPSDADQQAAHRNQEAAKEYLRRLNAPPTSQPLVETGPEP